MSRSHAIFKLQFPSLIICLRADPLVFGIAEHFDLEFCRNAISGALDGKTFVVQLFC